MKNSLGYQPDRHFWGSDFGDAFQAVRSRSSGTPELVALFAGDTADTATTPGFVESVPNGGTLGGSFPYQTTRPQHAVQFADLKKHPVFTGTARCASSLPASSWKFLHDGTVSYLITVRLCVYKNSAALNNVLCTQSGGSNRGIWFYHRTTNGNFGFNLNGASGSLIATKETAATNDDQNYTVQVLFRNTTQNIELFLDGVSQGTVSFAGASLGSTDPAFTLHAGNRDTGSYPISGALQEFRIHTGSENQFTPAFIAAQKSEVEAKWNSVPGVRCVFDAATATQSGGTVTAWSDATGINGAATITGSPSYVSSWRNGQPAVGGTGSSRVQRSFLAGSLSQPGCQIAVLDWTAPSAVRCVWAGSSGTDWFVRPYNDGSGGVWISAGNNVGSTVQFSNGDDIILGLQWNTTATKVRGIKSGAAAQESIVNAGTLPDSGVTLLASATNLTGWLGKVAYHMTLGHIPNAAGIAEIEAALGSRFNILAT